MRRFRIVLAVLACLVLVVGLSGCSEPDDKVWPKTTTGRSQVVVRVTLPAMNPNLTTPQTNYTTRLEQAIINDLAVQWDPHPDVKVDVQLGGNCPDQQVANCFEVWRVPASDPNPLIGGMAAPACWPNCAVALRFANEEHYTNGNSAASGLQRAVLVYPIEWETTLTDVQWRNMICHEGGHFLSLDHWDDDNDGTPDAQGPCVDAVPDRDTDPSDGTAAAYDWSALDLAYHQCRATTQPYAPAGWALQDDPGSPDYEPEVDAASDECPFNGPSVRSFSDHDPVGDPDLVTTSEAYFIE